jgi:hypothetical protein
MKTLLATFRSLLLVLIFFTACQLTATAQSQPAAKAAAKALTPDEQLFTGLLKQVGAATSKGDMTALGNLMAPEYVHYNPDNGQGNREQDLAYVGTWKNTTVELVGPVKVIRKGDMAVTVSNEVFSGQEKGKPFKNTMQMMIAWVLRNGKWQMAVVQSKQLPG